MLDLMDFKEEFVSKCRSTLCESGPFDMQIEERTVNKAQRGTLNGLLFRKEGLNCAPTFYVEDFYNAYKDGSTIADLSHQAVETAVHSMDLAGVFARNSSRMLRDPERLNVKLLNTGKNKRYLKGIPCKDLGCGFVYIAEIGQGEFRVVITKELLKQFGMSKEKLFGIALRNSMEQFPAVLYDLAESAMVGREECDNLLESTSGSAPAGTGPGYVLTNSSLFWGAGALFYPGVTDRIHQLLKGDFYVLPSSVHEVIVIKAEDQDPKELAGLIRSANRSVVEENEVLADDLYICESGKLRRVSYGGVIPVSPEQVC